jgi:PPM family protein phosphatase
LTVLRSGLATDVGRVRTTNEDLAFAGQVLFAVADGMGGHAAGEVAARLAIETVANHFGADPSFDGLRVAVEEANAAVWHESQSQSALRGMGTTVTAAALVPGTGDDDGADVIVLANVGDSRAYLLSEGALDQITLDHSLAEEKFRVGELTREQAEVHPQRHILTRALGVSGAVNVDVWRLQLRAGDRLLLCSDGLTNELSSDELAGLLTEIPDPQEAADALVRAANDRGGNDNITVVLVDVVSDDLGGSATTRVVPVPSEDGSAVGSPLALSSVVGAGAAAMPEAPAGVDDPLTGVVPQFVAPPPQSEAGAPAPVAPVVEPKGPPTDVPRRHESQPRAKESRHHRRRRLGIPRRITFRVLLFVLLVSGVVVAGYYFLRWYENDNYYVTLDHTQLVIYRGRPGGVLWFKPHVVSNTGVTTAQILPLAVPPLQSKVQEPTLAAAQRYVSNLQREFTTQQQQNQSSGTGGVGPSGVLPPVPVPTTSTPTTTPPPGPTPT